MERYLEKAVILPTFSEPPLASVDNCLTRARGVVLDDNLSFALIS